MTERVVHDDALAADGAARERALDIRRSFLVQAPAGSGKTELLIQRYLALLAHVDRPERILAMTFTRKAAGEMRERIIRALAAAETDDVAAAPHERRTRELARAALAQDARQGWQLLRHPARLAVQTIDAFCAGLARQAPIATRLGGVARFEERARPLYESAVREDLAAAPSGDPDWRRILGHFDNDASAVIAVLSTMLAKRDQWLRLLPHKGREAFRSQLEATLAEEICGELSATAALFQPGFARALPPFLRYAVANADGARHERIADHLAACADAGGVPEPVVEMLEQWRALASWLLLKDKPQFREQIDRNVGFPAKGASEGRSERIEQKENMGELLAALAEVPGLAEALHVARRLPSPRFTDEAWSVVSALIDLLPRLAARLTVAFRDAGVLDFTQGMLGALDALGSDEWPSDLLLSLDARIDHLLIDEFQDTSFTQLEIVRRLTAGWQSGDGRTVFAVGDPMQSIYRFREAEVRIFVEAKVEEAVAGVPVENLVLARNFRSHAGLVAWINSVFLDVLGSRNDPWRGAVAFAPSTADRPAPDGPAVTLDIVPDNVIEAERVVHHVRNALLAGNGSIAILVRARTHLDCLLPALRGVGIEYTAVELDALAERQAILDLASLTHALVQPADRLAWLAVLRAPWCGLALADLAAIVAAADSHPSRSIASVLDPRSSMEGLTADGRERLQRVAEWLRPALAARGRAPVAQRVRGAWLALGGAALLTESIDVGAADRFFALLDEHDVAGDVPDWPAFVAELDELRAEAAANPSVRVNVMTLHRAKGLEFDTVIIPGLARSPPSRDNELLRRRVRERGLLLAPARARGGEVDLLYTYLGSLAADEDRAELARLLYVGCTRARERLHLTASLEPRTGEGGERVWKAPGSATALARLWDVLGASAALPDAVPLSVQPSGGIPPLLDRVGRGWTVPPPAVSVSLAPAPEVPRDTVPFDWARETARAIGVVAHRFLAQFAREGLAAWSIARLDASLPRIRTELAAERVDEAEQDDAAAQVRAALASVLEDERGRWLFAPDHLDAASEWALAGIDDDAIVHVVLDRSFVTQGVRWIVDFKTGGHEGGDIAAFLDREQERYREQLERYARFVSALDSRPIRLGLYHPLLRGWREWPFAVGAA